MSGAARRARTPGGGTPWRSSPGTSCSPAPPASWPTWARRRPGQDALDHYMGVITDKTASLIATMGQFGAMFSGAPADVAGRLAPACAAIGVAWQLSDDILDVMSEAHQSGKTPGTDLREGIRTLPVLHALRAA